MPDPIPAGAVELTVIYEKAQDFHECYVNGAYGGVNPRGGVSAWLYLERQAEPESYTAIAEVGQDGAIVKVPSAPEHSPKFVRHIQVAIQMTPETAVSIGKWLQTHAENAIAMRSAAPPILDFGTPGDERQ